MSIPQKCFSLPSIRFLAFLFRVVADTAFGDRPRERARWAFRWLSRLNEVIAKGLATQLIGQTQYLRQQVERMR